MFLAIFHQQYLKGSFGGLGAEIEIRTRDPVLTMDVLYQLSYLGLPRLDV